MNTYVEGNISTWWKLKHVGRSFQLFCFIEVTPPSSTWWTLKRVEMCVPVHSNLFLFHRGNTSIKHSVDMLKWVEVCVPPLGYTINSYQLLFQVTSGLWVSA